MKAYKLEYREPSGDKVSIPFTAPSANGAFIHATTLAVGTKATLSDDHGPLCRIERASDTGLWRVKPVE